MPSAIRLTTRWYSIIPVEVSHPGSLWNVSMATDRFASQRTSNAVLRYVLCCLPVCLKKLLHGIDTNRICMFTYTGCTMPLNAEYVQPFMICFSLITRYTTPSSCGITQISWNILASAPPMSHDYPINVLSDIFMWNVLMMHNRCRTTLCTYEDEDMPSFVEKGVTGNKVTGVFH